MNQIAWNYFIWESFHGNKNLGRRWLLDFVEKGKNRIERVAPEVIGCYDSIKRTFRYTLKRKKTKQFYILPVFT